MKKTAICIRYRGETFVSEFIKRDEEELSILREVCATAVKGHTDYFEITTKEGDAHYISHETLVRSVISIIHEK
jgi:hypothetical protein